MRNDETTVFDIEQDATAPAHIPIGAYILGALPDSERIDFEAHLRECPRCQRELHELGPVVALLPRLYDDLEIPGTTIDIVPSEGVSDQAATEATALDVEQESTSVAAEPPTLEGVDRSVEATVPELDDPVLPDIASPAVEADASADESAETVPGDDAMPTPPTKTRRRPRGRIAPGEAPPEANVIALPRERGSLIPWAIAAVCGILAIGAILWALAMLGQIGDLKSERDLQDEQIAQLSQEHQRYLEQTPALVHHLAPTTAGASGAAGTVYLDPDPAGTGGIVVLEGMAQPPSGQVYQVWTLHDGQVTPGPTFAPDADGRTIVQLGGDAATADQLVITLEPTGGSQTPTTAPVMQGNLSA